MLFVDPPINAGRVFLRQIIRGLWGIKRLLTQTKKDDTSALVYTPINLLPVADLTSKMHVSRINELAGNHFDPARKTLLWIYHVEIPGIRHYIDNLDYDLLIYDCVDNYESFPVYQTEEAKTRIRDQEGYLARKATLVFATTPLLVEKLKAFNKNVFFTPNVGDFDKFKNVQQLRDTIPEELNSIPHPRVGFAGALDEYKFDMNLLKLLAKDHPNVSFVLIGQLALKDKGTSSGRLGIGTLPNVHLLGSKPYEILEYYYAGFDAYMIPYQLNDYTVGGCFPVKFHDALSAGLPTVVTNLPSYLPFKDVCYISRNYEEFSRNIKKALAEDSTEKIRHRREVASKNSWDSKVQTMLGYIKANL